MSSAIKKTVQNTLQTVVGLIILFGPVVVVGIIATKIFGGQL
jgi:hypothetical protein